MVIGFGDLARRLVPKLSGAAEIVGVSRRPELLPEGVTAVLGITRKGHLGGSGFTDTRRGYLYACASKP